MESTNRKTIAKNTIFLYFRMMLIMAVTLYTSRLILEVLGIKDYGLYQTVGGVVGLLSFINGAISTGSSRFLTFELGRDNLVKLKKTFNTTLISHLLIALLFLIFAETVGLWFVTNKIVIEEGRVLAIQLVYQFSIFTAIITFIQVPFVASIIAHENMKVYAYLSIIEVSFKLIIVYLLKTMNQDKLVEYSLMICIVQICIFIFYIIFCIKNYKETHFKFEFDKAIFKSIFSFSGWSLLASGSIAITEQGTTLITNMFFGPSVVVARAISIQVNMAANQFVNNFRTAINPQIVKQLAVGDIESSKQLLLVSVKYSYYLMLILGIPLFILADPLLHLWLVKVPEYSVIFLKLIIIQSIFSVFDTSFYVALYAKGRLRENALISPLVSLIRFPIVYILFKLGYSPIVLSYAGIITYFILGMVIKPILIYKFANYNFQEIFNVFISCIKVTLVALFIIYFYSFYLKDNILSYICTIFVCVVSVLLSVFYFGIDKFTRKKIYNYIIKLRIKK